MNNVAFYARALIVASHPDAGNEPFSTVVPALICMEVPLRWLFMVVVSRSVRFFSFGCDYFGSDIDSECARAMCKWVSWCSSRSIRSRQRMARLR